MAGYLFALGKSGVPAKALESRQYSTLMNVKWTSPTNGVLGDLVTMRPGDHVYFFKERRIYGIGRVVAAPDGRCVTENFPGATSQTTVQWSAVKAKAFMPDAYGSKKSGSKRTELVGRWAIKFEPDPAFLEESVDMDDLLVSDPAAFRIIRDFHQRSFIKVDDVEDLAITAALLRANPDHPITRATGSVTLADVFANGHEPDVPGLLAKNRSKDGSLKLEMFLEIGLLWQLAHHDTDTIDVFGEWDYLSHQVPASPAKPSEYMDHMDVFGYRYMTGFKPIVESYFVAELKRDVASADDVPQIMKYVDWVRSEYAHGDYRQVKAFLVAKSFRDVTTESVGARRDYTRGYRPAEECTWRDLTLVSYDVDEHGHITFARV